MDFRTLGGVEVSAGGRTYVPSRPMHRALLGLLLVEAGQVVAIDRLVDRLWPGRPPAGAAALVHTYASRLRRDLSGGADPPAGRLVTRRPGYTLAVEPPEHDVVRFEELSRRAAAAGDPAAVAAGAAAALALWRGRPYGDAQSVPVLEAEAERLEEVRLTTVELRLEADLRRGRDAELVGELSALVDAHPLRERLCRLLLTALARAGRPAEALAAYRAARDRIVAEVGVEPGPELRRVHAAILAGEPLPGAAPDVARPARPVPAQLPPAIADFTGRRRELAELLAAFGGSGPALPVVALSGPAGVGKSALAVQAAHLLRPRYPDGQLAVSLGGGGEVAADPAEVLGRFLRALGVDGAAVPAGLEERAESFRTLVADRRLLVLLDDAAAEAQVRPLLPGGAGCGVLVTSRRRPAGLAGARLLDLAPPTEAEALDLLAAVAGPGRVGSAPADARRIVGACGRLPLAVRIAGAKLAAAPHTALRQLADRLADERHRIDHLVVGDLDLRTGFRLSYEQLAEPEQAAFRRLGLLGPPEFDGWVVAALLDGPAARGDAALRGLAAARLVDAAAATGSAERHRMHDLLRSYAAELAAAEPEPARDAAAGRVLAGWLTLAEAAQEALPVGLRLTHRGPAPRRPLPVAEVRADPGGWFGAERAAVLAAVELAVRTGRDDSAWALAAAVGGLLDLHQAWAHREHVAGLGLAAARRTGDPRAEVQMLMDVGDADVVQGRFGSGRDRMTEALAVATAAGYAEGEAYVLFGMVSVHRVLGDLGTATDCALRARAAFAALGDRRAEAYATMVLGICEARLGRPAAAATHLRAALDRLVEHGDRHGQAQAGAFLATALRESGDLDGAVTHSERTHQLCTDIGDLVGGTVAVRELAACHSAAGRPARAVPLLEDAVAEVTRLGHRLGEAFLRLDLGTARQAAGQPGAAAEVRLAGQRFGQLGLAAQQASALALLAEIDADRADRPPARPAVTSAVRRTCR